MLSIALWESTKVMISGDWNFINTCEFICHVIEVVCDISYISFLLNFYCYRLHLSWQKLKERKKKERNYYFGLHWQKYLALTAFDVCLPQFQASRAPVASSWTWRLVLIDDNIFITGIFIVSRNVPSNASIFAVRWWFCGPAAGRRIAGSQQIFDGAGCGRWTPTCSDQIACWTWTTWRISGKAHFALKVNRSIFVVLNRHQTHRFSC